MSIVLLGSTSGSITLQEPAVAGSNTINLPAATGTAVLTGVSGNVDINAAGANNVTLSTNSTERMRIDSSGNVGIGTSSPSGRLHVANTGTAGTTADNLAVYFTSANRNSNVYIRAKNTDGSILNFSDGDSDTAGRLSYEHSDNSLRIDVNSAERMRITSGGDVLVGTTSSSRTSGAGVKLIPGATPVNYIVGASSVNNDSALDVYSTGAAAYRFQIGYGGTIYATSTTITGISDQRLKENIVDLDDGLDSVMALKPRKFDWKAGKGKDIKGDRGFIAQEFEQVFPDMIEESKDPVPEGEEPYKAVNANIIPTLVKAIQEQQAMIEELKAELDATKAEVQALKGVQ